MLKHNLRTHTKSGWLTHFASNENGSTTMMFVIGFSSILVILAATYTNTAMIERRDSVWLLHWKQALALAEAGVARTQDEFKNNAHNLDALLVGADGVGDTSDDGILSFGSSVNLGNGNFSVVITDNDDGDSDLYSDVDNTVFINSTGNVPIEPVVTRTRKGYISVAFGGPGTPDFPNIRGAINAAGPIETKGTLIVDGRDHQTDQTLVPNDGVFGISTLQAVNQTGSSEIGGTKNGVDRAPSSPGHPTIKETNADWSAQGGFPTTPDAVMQRPEGWLKMIAQMGDNGSQYVTDPTNLTFPLSGVTYVELAPGGVWQSIDFGTSSGILVVHSAATDAQVKNINSGTFTGILIADDILKIHATVLGTLVSLTPNPSAGNCIGNGSGTVLFCRAAIEQAAQLVVSSAPMLSWSH